MSRCRAAVAVTTMCGVLGLLAAACTSPSNAANPSASPTPTPSGPKVVPADYVSVVSGKSDDLVNGARTVSDRHNLLIGPHFAFEQEQVGTTRTLDALTATELGLSHPVKAAPGHELVVASFASSVRYSWAVASGGDLPGSRRGPTRQRLVVRGNARKLPARVGHGSVVILSVPTGVHPRLRVRDAGRSQALDLRTGQRVHDALSSYFPSTRWHTTRTSKRTKQDGGYAGRLGVATEVVTAEATLSPFAPRGTWGRRGHAWLYVSLRMQSYCVTATGPVTCRIAVSPRRHFVLNTPHGAATRIVGRKDKATSEVSADSGRTYGFEVSKKSRSATLTVSFTGRLTTTKGYVPWTRAPGPLRIRLKAR